jgi:tRNA pseudouridine13 synthase
MKLKCTPDDFEVEEKTALRPSTGPFGLYRLTKTSLGTPEAIDAILQKWNLARWQVAYAGLKDKHALTRQYVTMKGGPRQGLRQTNLELEYLGQVREPIHAKDIVANAFTIVLRDMPPREVAAAAAAMEQIGVHGLPNYFDDQRFGSLGKSGEFIAKPWCLGDYERALWLALAEPNVHDSPDEQQQKAILRELWGKWPECKAALARSHRRSVITFLADRPIQPDFKRALALIRQDLRSIFLSAFQSDLWNGMLAALLRKVCPTESLVARTIGKRDLPFYAFLDEPTKTMLRETLLPLPSARQHLEEGGIKALVDEVLAAEGMELRQVRLKFPRDTFFSKGERAALFFPADVSHDVAEDDFYRGKQKMTLRFELPRGAYATILVKRVTDINLEVEDAEEQPASQAASPVD